MTIMLIQGNQIMYFIQSNFPHLAFLSLTVKHHSWIPAPGHTQPQKALPRNSDAKNKKREGNKTACNNSL